MVFVLCVTRVQDDGRTVCSGVLSEERESGVDALLKDAQM